MPSLPSDRTPATAGQTWWIPGDVPPESGDRALHQAIRDVIRPLFLTRRNGQLTIEPGGSAVFGGPAPPETESFPLQAYVPALHPADLGDPVFRRKHNLRYPYIAGAMANGITSVEMVAAAGRGGMIGFFGAAGLSLEAIESAIDQVQARLGNLPFGFNLIHSPSDPLHEAGVVDLYLRREVRLVSASAYLGLSLPLVLYRVRGIHRDADGNIVCPNRVIAKVSRVEVAEKFFSPPPEKLLRKLVEQNRITPEEAELAARIPVADDLTAEADSGGHTDNRPALSLLPTMIALRDRMMETYKYPEPLCVGLGGGIATPESAAAAFAMGAAYVIVGSVHQACVEAGTSDAVRRMLAEARQADVIMAPAADMFEMGVKVQVLKRGTMFPLRAGKLYELYSRHDRYEEIPEDQRKLLERDYFRCSFDEAWRQTRAFFERRDPRQNERAETSDKHKMALVFRSYLGQSSRWAVTGDATRTIDYQIWCGPAMGAFNEWTRGTFLEAAEQRQTVTVGMNLLMGAAVVARVNWLRNQGVVLPPGVGIFRPMPLPEILHLLGEDAGR